VVSALIRPPCVPPDGLMLAPGKLAPLPDQLSEADALQAWLTDMAAYQALRGQTNALQAFVQQNCQ
jgi:hypothetical protein